MIDYYPLKFEPILKPKIWGGNKLNTLLHKKSPTDKMGESWEISAFEGDETMVCNGFLAQNNLMELTEIYMHDLVGRKVFDKFGLNFPLLTKFIDAADDLSIQVHPNNKLALEKHNSFGKNEAWYIIEAEPNAKIYLGFDKQITPLEFRRAIENKTVSNLMKVYQPKNGDFFIIPSGTVHSIGKGILLAEIQQNSDLTYRVYDWDRTDEKGNTRELHLDLALEATNFSEPTHLKINYDLNPNMQTELTKNEYFKINIMLLTKTIEMDYFLIDSFVIYMVVEGQVQIHYADQAEPITLKTGESALIPAELNRLTLTPKGQTKILETYIP